MVQLVRITFKRTGLEAKENSPGQGEVRQELRGRGTVADNKKRTRDPWVSLHRKIPCGRPEKKVLVLAKQTDKEICGPWHTQWEKKTV